MDCDGQQQTTVNLTQVGHHVTKAIRAIQNEQGQAHQVTSLDRYSGNLLYDGNGLSGIRPEQDQRA